ncbi:MAG: hypothetical protein KBG47_12500, partial [Bacteroidia bacterium]|nr:hypothetical protein [Bacteroidia bacterium]
MKRQFYNLVFILLSASVFSQNFSVFAKVVDEDDSSAIGAAVSLLNISDSSMVKAASVNLRGILKMQDIPAGNYILKIEFIEYKDEFRKIEVNTDLRLGKIKLKPDTK